MKDIELYSLCEHHLFPFIGRAHVAYIPNGKVDRPVEDRRALSMCSRDAANPGKSDDANRRCFDESACIRAGLAVVIEAKHLCMMMRGVEKQNSVMKTSCLLGVFKEDARTRSEFLVAAERLIPLSFRPKRSGVEESRGVIFP